MEYITLINDYLWTWLVIPLLVCCALWFTYKLEAFQFRHLGMMIRQLTESHKSNKNGEKEEESISSFHAFVVSLASRIGTGNLAGVASAIFVGGPGAVFWMWVMALLGSATAFAESTLAQYYKVKVKGAYIGGPAYYMYYGLHKRWLGVIFSICMILSFAMANQIMQSNQISASLSDTFGIPSISAAVVLAIMIGAIILGGIHRIAKVSSYIVPFMAIAYLLLAFYLIITNITEIPGVLYTIVSSAFGVEQAAGGAIGITISQGVKRGLFSNEAGEGSAPNAAATAETTHPVKQGLVQALGVFTDTLVVCTCTAVIILLSGVYKSTDADGIILTTRALETHIGPWARYFISAAIFFFAFSSIIGNYYYGETSVRFLTPHRRYMWIFRAITVGTVIVGGLMTLDDVWAIIDLCMCSIVLLNIYSILKLSPKVSKLWKNYNEQRARGVEPEFHKEMIPEDSEDVKTWL
ncbi:MAG: alanine/glycine:cation symporter family protein [Bacteroidia bacterium]|nr:alanine/glycine:cation symporter family protein [Bacteroidia bacterium]